MATVIVLLIILVLVEVLQLLVMLSTRDQAWKLTQERAKVSHE